MKTQVDTREWGVKKKSRVWSSAVLLKTNELFKASVESKSTEWTMMVSQGDIALLQRITQPEAQSQSLSDSAGLACGRQRKGRSGAAAPCTLHWNWASFQGETGLLSPPRPGREFRDENANESANSDIFVLNDRTGSSHTKTSGYNYIVNIKCLSPSNWDNCNHLFVHWGQDSIKTLQQ